MKNEDIDQEIVEEIGGAKNFLKLKIRYLTLTSAISYSELNF